jgi:hypothetical protein
VIVSFMVPPQLLHDGRNDARVYLNDGARLVCRCGESGGARSVRVHVLAGGERLGR